MSGSTTHRFEGIIPRGPVAHECCLVAQVGPQGVDPAAARRHSGSFTPVAETLQRPQQGQPYNLTSSQPALQSPPTTTPNSRSHRDPQAPMTSPPRPSHPCTSVANPQSRNDATSRDEQTHLSFLPSRVVRLRRSRTALPKRRQGLAKRYPQPSSWPRYPASPLRDALSSAPAPPSYRVPSGSRTRTCGTVACASPGLGGSA